MTESNNTAYANITVLQNSPNGPVVFNITAYDGAGNEFNVTQNDASANVIIDTANPTLSNLTIYSDNAHNTSLATLDDTLNITITTNENLSSANITILGAMYTMSTSGMVANASVTVNSSHADGQVEFSITTLDLAGNSLTVTQANLNSSNLTIDKNVPSVTNLTLYSNNSDPSLARAGDLINITLEVSEQIYNATLQILGTETSMTESNNTAYANITVLQNSPNGLAAFNITAYDGAGNEFNVTQNDTYTNVIIDTANPTLSNLTIYSNNAHNTSLATLDDALNITITANENLSSANITILGATYTMSTSGMVANTSVTVNSSHADGKVEFNITAFDLAGNSLTVTQTNLNSSNLTIDHTNPTLSNLTIYSNNAHNTSLATLGDTLNITITANENLSSAEIMLLNSTYAMNITGQIANASVIVNASHADGQVEFNITTFDLAGNNLTVTQANLNSPDLTIDKNVPSVSNLSLYSNNSDPSLARAGDLINITLEVSEQIYNATLQILGTEMDMTESNNTAYANITVLENSQNGHVAFNITAYDGAGNEFNSNTE